MFPNYTGPYRSNGKFQTSVEFGDKIPIDQLDALSRLHDTAYARYDDYGHRVAADIIYNNEAKKLNGVGPLAGLAVTYGNQLLRSGTSLGKGVLTAGPIGGLFSAVKNLRDIADLTTNIDKYTKDILELYAQDPMDGVISKSNLDVALINLNVNQPVLGPIYTAYDPIKESKFAFKQDAMDAVISKSSPVTSITEGSGIASAESSDGLGGTSEYYNNGFSNGVYDPLFFRADALISGRRKGKKWRKRK